MSAAAQKDTGLSAAVTREVQEFNINWGLHGILQLITTHHQNFNTVLDVGSGAGEHSRFFKLFGKQVFSMDLHEDADYVGDFLTYDFDRKFDAIWCSHVLEHQRNVGQFLEKLYNTLEDDGILAISLPVHSRSHFISGHLTNWNAGLLIYNLVMSGFDCRDAIFAHDYDLSLIVRKRPARGGDILTAAAYSYVEELAEFFPFPVRESGDAEVRLHNWSTNYTLAPLGRPVTLKINNKLGGSIVANID